MQATTGEKQPVFLHNCEACEPHDQIPQMVQQWRYHHGVNQIGRFQTAVNLYLLPNRTRFY